MRRFKEIAKRLFWLLVILACLFFLHRNWWRISAVIRPKPASVESQKLEPKIVIVQKEAQNTYRSFSEMVGPLAPRETEDMLTEMCLREVGDFYGASTGPICRCVIRANLKFLISEYDNGYLDALEYQLDIYRKASSVERHEIRKALLFGKPNARKGNVEYLFSPIEACVNSVNKNDNRILDYYDRIMSGEIPNDAKGPSF